MNNKTMSNITCNEVAWSIFSKNAYLIMNKSWKISGLITWETIVLTLSRIECPYTLHEMFDVFFLIIQKYSQHTLDTVVSFSYN